MGFVSQPLYSSNPMATMGMEKLPPHSQHPGFGHLTLLVFEAVLEVVCVSLPGYIVARQGMFNAEMQKFAANLNVMLFTPCLIFTKLASQLRADTIGELGLIPAIFLVQTLVSYLCSIGVSRLFRFQKRPRNFVIAMGVFGNSNSLPISLVLSLSQTINGLHWEKIPKDNDDEVAARGILYLLIFQQLGQLLRWSWGYNVLLAPFKDSGEEGNDQLERGRGRYTDDPNGENRPVVDGASVDDEEEGQYVSNGSSETNVEDRGTSKGSPGGSHSEQHFVSGEQTPMTHGQYTSSTSSRTSSRAGFIKPTPPPDLLPTPANGNILPSRRNNHTSASPFEDEHASNGPWGVLVRCRLYIKRQAHVGLNYVSEIITSGFKTLPKSLQKALGKIYIFSRRFLLGLWSFMNPPLWAMLAAIVVAAIPSLQSLFFSEGTFIKNSITSAVSQSAGVAVPLILVVLGANLARNTLPENPNGLDQDDREEETKLLIAALVSRMLLPTIIMTPILALTAKYTPISILEDPIFVVVCFLLTGAPSALQLAQICQINNVYMGTITRLLFQSYVVWILPSTLVLVMLALEVVEWAGA